MGFGIRGYIEWSLISSETGEIVASGEQYNLVYDNGRKEFLGGWQNSSTNPIIAVASGTAEPQFTDTTLDTIVTYSSGPGESSATDSYTSPTVTYQVTLADPTPDNFTIHKIGLVRAASVSGSAPNFSSSNPLCAVKLSNPVQWDAGNQFQVTYNVTIEKFADED